MRSIQLEIAAFVLRLSNFVLNHTQKLANAPTIASDMCARLMTILAGCDVPLLKAVDATHFGQHSFSSLSSLLKRHNNLNRFFLFDVNYVLAVPICVRIASVDFQTKSVFSSFSFGWIRWSGGPTLYQDASKTGSWFSSTWSILLALWNRTRPLLSSVGST